ncbi:hypothetical protein RP20_CCG026358 [Aedes albopictus]|nr:hypothetical protein RP20_CCG026358 [Aedes albopictus]
MMDDPDPFVPTIIERLPQLLGSLAENQEYAHDLSYLRYLAEDKYYVPSLLSHGALEVFVSKTETSEDNQLVRILLAMIVNMCREDETHRVLYENEALLLRLCLSLNSRDPLVLDQIMMLLTTILEQSNDEYFWFQIICQVHGIAERLAFILHSATHWDLFKPTLDVVHAMVERFTETEADYVEMDKFYEIFGKTCLIEGLTEGFKNTFPFELEDFVFPTKLMMINKFLDIHENFIINVEDVYEEDQIENTLECLYRILVPMSAEYCLNPLYKANSRIIVRIIEFSSNDNVRQFHAGMYRVMLKIFAVFSTIDFQDYFKQDKKSNDKDRHAGCCRVGNQKTLQYVLGYLYHMAQPMSSLTIANAMKLSSSFNEKILRRLCAALQYTMKGDPLLKKTLNLLRESARIAWNVERNSRS